jgi:hypothetical protein
VDLTGALLRFATRRPRVLVVPVVGGTAVRLAAEAELARRGWPLAHSPADTDVLLVAGVAGPGLGPVVDRLWDTVPAPRARAAATAAAEGAAALDTAARLLGDARHQRRTSGSDPEGPDRDADAPDTDAPDADGPVMADVGPDRDGLTLDRLHVPLGPVLPDWPAGLVLRVTLQGDVIQEATAQVLDAARAGPGWPGGSDAARELDALGRFLAVAGWADAAARARRLRDRLLAGEPPGRLTGQVDALAGRVRGSRVLAWLVRGVPAGPLDVATLLDRRLDAAQSGSADPDRPAVDGLPDLLVGAELAAARLVVAALDPDTDQTTRTVRHG